MNLCSDSAVCEKHGVDLTAEDIKYLYFVRTYKSGRFNFWSKDKLGTTIVGPGSKSDGTWCDRFFYVKADSMCGPEWTRFKLVSECTFLNPVVFLYFCISVFFW